MKLQSQEVTCEETLAACDEAFTSEQAAHEICEDMVRAKEEKIQADKLELAKQSAAANHSHVPHVTATSAFWLLLLILL